MAGSPRGFSASKAVAGIHAAMTFGAPSRATDQATFFIQQAVTPAFPIDQQGVPWDPADRVTVAFTQVQVPVAIEFKDDAGKIEGFGVVAPVKIVLTLLDVDYQQIKNFDFVVVAGRRYLYRRTETPVALGTVDVWTVHCVAEDSP